MSVKSTKWFHRRGAEDAEFNLQAGRLHYKGQG